MGIYYIGGMSYSSDELYHYGIKGQKWGIRRFQNPDGSYTQAGLKRYRKADARADLGYTRFQRLNNVQNSYTDRYKTDIKGYMKNTKKSQSKFRRERKKEEYKREAKAFLQRSEILKSMNTNYNSIFKSDQKHINARYRDEIVNNGRNAAMDYLDREMLRRKVTTDRQKDIWDRA